MRVLYLDCSSGIAGDMLLGALIDLGLDLEYLKEELGKLPLEGYTISARKTVRSGISGIQFGVSTRGHHHHHRGWREIRGIIGGSTLSEDLKETALGIFRRLIEAEARIHRVPFQKVHLHEVGAVDAIVDITGAVIALRKILGAGGKLYASPLHLGGGRVKMAHGIYPVPPPATVALLKGVPVVPGPVEGELVTPTGAAIVSSLASGFGPMPPMTIGGVGYGAGTRKYEEHPNVLRALLGETRGKGAGGEQITVIECTIDDMNPQGYGYLMDRLFEAGAVEVFYTAVQMKKGRPGTLVTVICPDHAFDGIAGILFRESTTIGLRHRRVDRIELQREIVTVKTVHGKVRVKVSAYGGEAVQAQPEYEDCRRIASRRKVPLKEVQGAAAAAFRAGELAPAAPAGGASRKRAATKAGRRAAGESGSAAPEKAARKKMAAKAARKPAAGKASGVRRKVVRKKVAGRRSRS